jgi:hypothetical protein
MPRDHFLGSKLRPRHPRRGARFRSRWRTLAIEPLEMRALLTVVAWDGGGNDFNWHNPVNWVGDQLPGADDHVVISEEFADVTISSSANVTITSLTSAAGLTITAGTFTIATESEINNGFTLGGSGVLTGAGTLDVSGLFTWTGGSMTGSGATNAEGGLTIDGSSAKTIHERTLNNVGTATWTGTGNLNGGVGSTINNLVTGLFDIRTDAAFGSGVVGTKTFHNAGTLRKSVAVGTTTVSAWDFNNTGTVVVQTGTLSVNSGGSSAGAFSLAQDATLAIASSSYTLNAGASASGAGMLLVNGGTLTVAADAEVEVENFTLSSGTLTGAGRLDVTGLLRWTGGLMTGSGATNATGTLEMSGSSAKTIHERTLNNAGTATWTGTGNLNGGVGSTINNLVTGLFDIQTDAAFGSGVVGTKTFHNAGTLRKSVAAGTTTVSSWDFNNTGTVVVQTGTLSVNSGGSSTGAFSLAQDATLAIASSSYTLNAGASASGAGVLLVNGGTLTVAADAEIEVENFTLSSGTLTGAGRLDVPGLLRWTGGLMTGSGATNATGTLEMSGSGAKTIHERTLNNAGTATWTGTGNLNGGVGSTINNLVTGLFDIRTDAAFGSGVVGTTTFHNAGTLRKSVAAGTTTVSAWDFNNTGTVVVQTGTLSVNSGGSSTGVFSLAQDATLAIASSSYTLNAGASASGAGVLLVNGGTLTVAADAEIEGENFTLSSGTLTGAGRLDVPGLLRWTGGLMTGSGATNATGTLEMSGSSAKTIHERTLNNAGTATWTGTGNLNGGVGSTINNLVTGLFDIRTDATFGSGVVGTTTFNNAGTLRKSVAAGTTTVSAWDFNNTGTVVVQTGTLSVNSGGSSTGVFSLAQDATLAIASSSYTLNAGASASGAGVLLVNGGTLTVAADAEIEVENFTLSSGTLTGAGRLDVTGLLRWTGGSMTGSGATDATGTLEMSGSGAKTIHERTLNNAGTATWTGTGNLNGGVGSTINNLVTGLFDIRTDAAFGSGVVGTTTFNNAGTLRKSVAAGTTTVSAWDFNNTGTVVVQTGIFAFGNGFTQTAGVTLLNGGSVNSSQTMAIQGGNLAGRGTITGNVNNSGGTVIPGTSPGQLTITGNYTQGPAGSLAIEIGGLDADTQFDQLVVGGTATLGGTLAVDLFGGFVPEIGNSFLIVGGTTTGGFDALALPALPLGRAWELQDGSVTLAVVMANGVWDGGGDGTSWHDPDNWSNDVLPGPDDHVVVSDAFAGVTIISGANMTINSLTSEAGLTISAARSPSRRSPGSTAR